MMLGGTPSEVNPNSLWLNSRGMWLSYTIGVLLLHLILLSFPFLSVAWVWTLTNISHNTAMFFIFHIVKGTPWETGDQGKVRYLTHWEQIDNGEQFTATRKFLTVVPIVLFFLTSFYTKYDSTHFFLNFAFLILVLLPKLPQFHMVGTLPHNEEFPCAGLHNYKELQKSDVLYTSINIVHQFYSKMSAVHNIYHFVVYSG